MTRPLRLLAVSNGHGEDDIACKILTALRPLVPDLHVEAWPMMGHGRAYGHAGVPTSGPAAHPPSEGFGTLSAGSFLRDVAGGYPVTLARQYRHARALRGRFDLLLGVGDIVPLGVAQASRIPMAFVACAKSAYYHPPDGHNVLERRWMRHHCIDVFPRDRRTAEGFARAGIDATYLGNPMMDGLGDLADVWPTEPDTATVLMLPGSRRDAGENGRLLLDAAGRFADRAGGAARFLFPLHPATDTAPLTGASGWERTVPLGDTLRLRHASGAVADLARARFGPMARAARLCVGMAGTANEQAIGLGLPLITLPGAGNQGAAYVKMKMRYFGEAAVSVSRDPARVAEAMHAILADPDRAARMAAAGRERMGAPGASAGIAARLAARLAEVGARRA